MVNGVYYYSPHVGVFSDTSAGLCSIVQKGIVSGIHCINPPQEQGEKREEKRQDFRRKLLCRGIARGGFFLRMKVKEKTQLGFLGIGCHLGCTLPARGSQVVALLVGRTIFTKDRGV